MKILIADDHTLVRDMLVAFFRAEASIETAAVGTVEDAIKMVNTSDRFDLILLDFRMPGMNGLEGLKMVQNIGAGQRVALISGDISKRIVEDAIDAGAAGFIPKSLPAKSLVNAVKFMILGEVYVPIDFMTTYEEKQSSPVADNLTERELQVLKGLTEAKSNKEIGRDLGIREPTVKLHVKTLYRKLAATNRTQAALIARENGLF